MADFKYNTINSYKVTATYEGKQYDAVVKSAVLDNGRFEQLISIPSLGIEDDFMATEIVNGKESDYWVCMFGCNATVMRDEWLENAINKDKETYENSLSESDKILIKNDNKRMNANLNALCNEYCDDDTKLSREPMYKGDEYNE